MSAATKEAPENPETFSEEDRVRMHRTAFFLEIFGLEVDEVTIDTLVDSPVSPHEARELRKNGCPLPLIPKILL